MHNEIHVVGLEFVGKHGCWEEERRDGRSFKVDVIAHVGSLAGFASDTLRDTVNYETIARCVLDVGLGASCHLVEHLAERMAAAVLELDGVDRVEMTVYKHAPGVPGGPPWVGVRVVRP